MNVDKRTGYKIKKVSKYIGMPSGRTGGLKVILSSYYMVYILI